jgi:hypothetical protein
MGVVYALQHGTEEKFKIGLIRSGTADARRKALSTGNPNRLKLVAEIETVHHNACENYLHRTLGSKRIAEGDGAEWFAISLEELQTAFARARQYMAEYADDLVAIEGLEGVQPDGQSRVPTEEELLLYRKAVELRQAQSRIGFELELIENKLKIAIGKSAGLDGVATWKAVVSSRLDLTRLKEERPDVYKAFLKPPVPTRTFRLK